MILVIYCVSFWGQETEFRQSHVVFCTLVMVLNGSSFFCLFLGSGDGVSSRTHCRFLHSGDGVKLTTRGLFLKVTDGTNGDDVGVEEADDGDVHGESG